MGVGPNIQIINALCNPVIIIHGNAFNWFDWSVEWNSAQEYTDDYDFFRGRSNSSDVLELEKWEQVHDGLSALSFRNKTSFNFGQKYKYN